MGGLGERGRPTIPLFRRFAFSLVAMFKPRLAARLAALDFDEEDEEEGWPCCVTSGDCTRSVEWAAPDCDAYSGMECSDGSALSDSSV